MLVGKKLIKAPNQWYYGNIRSISCNELPESETVKPQTIMGLPHTDQYYGRCYQLQGFIIVDGLRTYLFDIFTLQCLRLINLSYGGKRGAEYIYIIQVSFS